MAETIADLLNRTLVEAGVKRIWGVTGDSLTYVANGGTVISKECSRPCHGTCSLCIPVPLPTFDPA